jgi:hypothetical protein
VVTAVLFSFFSLAPIGLAAWRLRARSTHRLSAEATD